MYGVYCADKSDDIGFLGRIGFKKYNKIRYKKSSVMHISVGNERKITLSG